MINKTQFSIEQTNAYNSCMEFVKTPAPNMMTISGYAGTGKTAMMRVLVDDLEQLKYKVVCTAPTNEAVRVLAKLTGKKYNKTIYSLLGLQLVEEDDREPILKSNGDSKLPGFDVVIVDEASMIHYDLFVAIQYELMMCSRCKMIFVGDPAQLPPVKDPLKESMVFTTKTIPIVYLTEIQRTAKDNPILVAATLIRNNLKTKTDLFERITKVNGISGIEFTEMPQDFLDKVLDDFQSDEYKKNNDYVRLLAYTNRTVDGFNDLIRKKIWNNESPPEFIIGEKLIVDTPVVNHNRSFREVIYNVGERLEVLDAKIIKDTALGVDYWELYVINKEALNEDEIKPYTLSIVCKPHIDMFRQKTSKIAVQCKKKLLEVDCNADGISKKRYTNAEAWKPYFNVKNRFHKVRYNYALTVHKSQGSTFERVYVVEMDINKLNWDDIERNKLKYVAFTRASHLLRIL